MSVISVRYFFQCVSHLLDAFFFVMLPARIGLEQTISPYSWGFEFTTPLKIGYLVLMTALALWAWAKGKVNLALTIAFSVGVMMRWPADETVDLSGITDQMEETLDRSIAWRWTGRLGSSPSWEKQAEGQGSS